MPSVLILSRPENQTPYWKKRPWGNIEKEADMKRMVPIILIGFVIVLIHGVSFAEERPGNPSNGKAIYSQHCLRCHGEKGDGQGPDASSLTVKPTNFLSQQSRVQTDLTLLSTIVWGSVYSPMHGWVNRISGQDMRDLVAYIRTIAPFQPVPEYRIIQ
jgi:mono/diheme cytochrome c family protein